MEKIKKLSTFKNIFIAILVIAILILYNSNNKTKDIKIIKVPELKIKTDTIYLNKIIPINIKQKDGTVVVNKDTYDKYEKEKDTLKKKEVFINAIEIRNNSTVVKDDSIAKIIVNTVTEGKLVSIQADVFIKERNIEIKQNKRPVSLILETDLYYNQLKFNPVINAGIQTRNGNIYKVGVGLDKSVMIGFGKTFTLIK